MGDVLEFVVSRSLLLRRYFVKSKFRFSIPLTHQLEMHSRDCTFASGAGVARQRRRQLGTKGLGKCQLTFPFLRRARPFWPCQFPGRGWVEKILCQSGGKGGNKNFA